MVETKFLYVVVPTELMGLSYKRLQRTDSRENNTDLLGLMKIVWVRNENSFFKKQCEPAALKIWNFAHHESHES
jgi:hypothetical protein